MLGEESANIIMTENKQKKTTPKFKKLTDLNLCDSALFTNKGGSRGMINVEHGRVKVKVGMYMHANLKHSYTSECAHKLYQCMYMILVRQKLLEKKEEKKQNTEH